jgi:SAM-dependent methyltransferase
MTPDRDVNRREYETMFRVEDWYWWYRGMRLIARRMAPDLFALPPGARLLDAGCGTGANLVHLGASGGGGRAHGTGIDASPDALRLSRARGIRSLANASLLALPFRAASFDAAVCHDVLVCIEDDSAALRELARVLKPGARLYVTAAALEVLRSDHDRAVAALRRYDRDELVGKLEAAGFRVERARYVNVLLFLPILVARRLRSLLARARTDADATSDFGLAPGALDRLLFGVLALEARLVAHVSFPAGVTLAVAARRKSGLS